MSLDIHEPYMRRAIEVAEGNRRHPFGAVIVHRESAVIVAEGVNQSSQNPTLHGEIDAINTRAEAGEIDWHQLALYTTAEPCPMCMGAILWSGIGCVVYGTSIPTLMQLGWKQIDISAVEVVAKSHRSDCNVISGVLQAECDAMFRQASTQIDAS